MDDKENKIVEWLVKTYQPKAIILHGSRANETASQKSDWDVIILTEEQITSPGRILVDGAAIDLSITVLPVADNFIFESRGVPLCEFKVLLDNTVGILSSILDRTLQAYKSGPPKLDTQGLKNRQTKLQTLIDKVNDNVNDPIVAGYYLAEIVQDPLTRYWFELNGQWPQSYKKALTQIEREDSEYYALISTLFADNDYSKKAAAIRDIYAHLFGKL